MRAGSRGNRENIVFQVDHSPLRQGGMRGKKRIFMEIVVLLKEGNLLRSEIVDVSMCILNGDT